MTTVEDAQTILRLTDAVIALRKEWGAAVAQRDAARAELAKATTKAEINCPNCGVPLRTVLQKCIALFERGETR